MGILVRKEKKRRGYANTANKSYLRPMQSFLAPKGRRNQDLPQLQKLILGYAEEIKKDIERKRYSRMSGTIRQEKSGNVRKNLTIKQGEDYKSFFMKKSTWELICTLRGWTGKKRRGAAARFAEEIKVSRQYAYDLVSGVCGCSSNVMRKVIDLLGIKGDNCWCHLFDKYNLRNVDPNHPIFNNMKNNGEIPYTHFSSCADENALDYKVERKPLESEFEK